MKNIFVQGPISSQFIADSIAKHQHKTNIGAHSIFLGQVREDEIGDSKVKAIEYTCYETMALEKMDIIREEIFSKFQLTCMHIYHSLGRVQVGEMCLFVFTSSAHRHDAIEACNEVVERIKKELPIWGKELLDGEGGVWKVNQ